jgi:hypothetical protein
MPFPDCGQDPLLQTNTALVEILLASLHGVNEQLNRLDRALVSAQHNASTQDLVRDELLLLRSSLEHTLLILQLQRSRLLRQSRLTPNPPSGAPEPLWADNGPGE